MVPMITDYMVEYKRSLNYLVSQLLIESNPDTNQLIKHIISIIRKDWFHTYASHMYRYFYPVNCFTSDRLAECECFVFDNLTRGIMKVDDLYHVVYVDSIDGGAVTFKNVDTNFVGCPFPEYIMADYLVAKGF